VSVIPQKEIRWVIKYLERSIEVMGSPALPWSTGLGEPLKKKNEDLADPRLMQLTCCA
jgi:hypothetical protein